MNLSGNVDPAILTLVICQVDCDACRKLGMNLIIVSKLPINIRQKGRSQADREGIAIAF